MYLGSRSCREPLRNSAPPAKRRFWDAYATFKLTAGFSWTWMLAFHCELLSVYYYWFQISKIAHFDPEPINSTVCFSSSHILFNDLVWQMMHRNTSKWMSMKLNFVRQHFQLNTVSCFGEPAPISWSLETAPRRESILSRTQLLREWYGIT